MNNGVYGQQLFSISSSTHLFLSYRTLYVEDSKISHPKKHWESNQEFIMFATESQYTKKRLCFKEGLSWGVGSKMKFKPRFNILRSHVLCLSPENLFSDHVATQSKSLARFQPPLTQLSSTLNRLYCECNENFLHNVVNYSKCFLVGLS